MMERMNKLLILILFFFSSFQLIAQDNEIEDFINQTCFEFVPKDFEYFNLLEKSYNVEFDEYSLFPQELKKILNDYPDFPHPDSAELHSVPKKPIKD